MQFKKHRRDASFFILSSFEIFKLKQLCHLATYLDSRKAIPATSSNFSLKTSNNDFLISRSGIHKRDLNPSQFVRVNIDGDPLNSISPKPSDETLLHSLIYKNFNHANVVAHIHAPEFEKFTYPKKIFLGHELLKAFGIKSHTENFELPVFENSQDMKGLYLTINNFLSENKLHNIAFMLEKHGIYCFGSSIEQVQNYLEAFLHLSLKDE